MKESRFTDEQRIGVVRQPAAGTQNPRAVSEAWDHRDEALFWRAKYGGLQMPDAKGLEALEDENRRLKKLVADLAPDNAMLKDMMRREWSRRHTDARRHPPPGVASDPVRAGPVVPCCGRGMCDAS
jgi:putative transposase